MLSFVASPAFADAKQSNAHSESLANGTGGAHGVDGSTDDGGSSEASADYSQQLASAKQKKPKAPKAKKPTPASAAAALKLGDIASVSMLFTHQCALAPCDTKHVAHRLFPHQPGDGGGPAAVRC